MSKTIPAAFQATLHIRDHCLCLHAQRAARRLARRFDEAFRPLGITSGQFSLMNGLNRPTPPPISALATLLAMDRSTVTANLKPLERQGLATVSIDPEDRRSAARP
ncbi:MarR family winged helix-turn-helix transcriptional regulator [Brevundimonas abyssalis]|uniref:Organic hydroperoxide resistance transcriptional regulator n=1 Tax=Brevundimonas abyssalis TAR-001 TaxID=1391729 RepID=A0A8E0NAL2_9CAUL|nr:MarR family transcriptional regulator [Brevundimonas abyssalis]GAD57867.1 organic hydroperoxide resistance transcriptional regulator [Brevundimonas abyssalis TAR-001]